MQRITDTLRKIIEMEPPKQTKIETGSKSVASKRGFGVLIMRLLPEG